MSQSAAGLIERPSSVRSTREILSPEDRSKLIRKVAKRIERYPNRCFQAIDIESLGTDRATALALRTTGNALQAVREAMTGEGEEPIEDSAGAIVNSLRISIKQLHSLVCYCAGSETVTARELARRVHALLS
jgi:hypothetical protein